MSAEIEVKSDEQIDEGEAGAFEPRLIGFLCNWCTYTGADLAGVSRLQYPPNLIPIRVMCTGGVDPVYVVKSLVEGADAVLVSGCHPGDCHYLTGNYKARRRMVVLKTILERMGFEPERMRLEWISASEGGKFQEVVTEMIKKAKDMGPNPLKGEWSV